MANEALALRPPEFWCLTPAELGDMIAGAKEREEREWKRTAWHVVHMLNVSGKILKQPMTVDQLLGKKQVQPKDPGAEFEALWSRIQENGAEEVN